VTRAAVAGGGGSGTLGEGSGNPAVARTDDLDSGQLAVDPDGRLLVGTGDGSLELLEVRPEGRRAMSGAEFARGARLGPDERLGQ